MLVFALDYHKAIDIITVDREMRKYELSEGEWELVEQLWDVLEVRRLIAYHFSRSHCLLVDIQVGHPFLLVFDTEPCHCDIDTYLTTVSQDLKRAPAIRAALALGKGHLDKYYDMSDHSEVYRIAMSECCSFDDSI